MVIESKSNTVRIVAQSKNLERLRKKEFEDVITAVSQWRSTHLSEFQEPEYEYFVGYASGLDSIKTEYPELHGWDEAVEEELF